MSSCVICKINIDGYGHNPEPLFEYKEGRACDVCNETLIIPARIYQLVK